MVDSSATRILLEKFKQAASEAERSLLNEEYQQAMALFYDASQSADEMTERFLTLLIKTAPSNSHRALIVEFLSWRLRYYSAQYDYHLSVAQTLTGLPREEWIARLETILILSQSLVGKLLPILKEVEDLSIKRRIRELLTDWVDGIHNLVDNLKAWNMASAQASRVLEWALDNELGSK
ncbi:MAG: hypothetical protein ACXADL_00665 [Candidatus Thorarchaeota archaeon]